MYPGKYEPEMLVKLLVSEKVDFSHCVPTLLNMVVSAEAIALKKVDLTGWKVLVGGSALTQALASRAWALRSIPAVLMVCRKRARCSRLIFYPKRSPKLILKASCRGAVKQGYRCRL